MTNFFKTGTKKLTTSGKVVVQPVIDELMGNPRRIEDVDDFLSKSKYSQGFLDPKSDIPENPMKDPGPRPSQEFINGVSGVGEDWSNAPIHVYDTPYGKRPGKDFSTNEYNNQSLTRAQVRQRYATNESNENVIDAPTLEEAIASYKPETRAPLTEEEKAEFIAEGYGPEGYRRTIIKMVEDEPKLTPKLVLVYLFLYFILTQMFWIPDYVMKDSYPTIFGLKIFEQIWHQQIFSIVVSIVVIILSLLLSILGAKPQIVLGIGISIIIMVSITIYVSPRYNKKKDKHYVEKQVTQSEQGLML